MFEDKKIYLCVCVGVKQDKDQSIFIYISKKCRPKDTQMESGEWRKNGRRSSVHKSISLAELV